MKLTQTFLSCALAAFSCVSFAADAVIAAAGTSMVQPGPWAHMQSRVAEAGRMNDQTMIVFVSDTTEEGKAFEKRFFGNGGQAINKLFDGSYVQIADVSEVPDFVKAGTVIALTADGSMFLTAIDNPSSMSQLRLFYKTAKLVVKYEDSIQKVASIQ